MIGFSEIVVLLGPVLIIEIVSIWRVFAKAGRPGWACVVPVYGLLLLCDIAGVSRWGALLLAVPYVNVLTAIPVTIALARSFGKGPGFGVGLAILGFVFFPVLAFGEIPYLRDVPKRSSTVEA